MKALAARSRPVGIALFAFIAGACAPAGVPPAEGPAPAVAPAAAEGGLLPLRYDAATGKVFLTVPRLGERLLYLNTLATGVGATAAGLDRGQLGDNAVVRFERRGARVYLIRENTAVLARTDNPALQRSVEESFPSSVLASFVVQRDGPGGTVVDATDFFLSDVYDVIGSLRGARLGSVRLDRERSFIDSTNTRSFPENTEIRSVLTFSTDDPSFVLRQVAPDARTIAIEQHHSFLRLPAPPLPLRPFDPRSGLFSNDFFDFAQPFSGDYRQRAVVRWRLEPSDTAAYLRGEKVEPVKPIVYYIDAGIPEPYRSAFIDGGRWWNEVLGAAGWRNAFRIESLPAGVSPLDARYPAIYWVHRMQRGPSVGPSMIDPRTGEIVKTVVRMDSYRSLVDHDIYMGLLPAAPPGGLQLTAEQFAMARRRQHSAHEIGHTLGIAHNYIAATQGRSSVMDYPYPLITLDAQGRLDISDAYRNSGGAHDTLAIRYAYTWFRTPAEEAAGLSRIVRDAEARGLRFIADQHVGAAGSFPSASQWIEGSDMLTALRRTMAVRRVLMDRFDERAAQPGEPLAVLNRRFAHVYLHHRYALVGATKYVGGMEFGYALRGEQTEPTRILPAAEQRAALRLVLSALTPRELRIPGRIAAMIPPVPAGYDSDLTLIPTPAGTAFDPIAAAHSLAQEIVNGLLHPQRAARLVSFHARDASNLSLDEVITALIETTWGTSTSDVAGEEQGPELRRVAQRATVDGLLDLAGNSAATAGVRATVEHHLALLARRANLSEGLSAADQGHRAAIRRDIERYFDGRDDPAKRPRPAPIGLPWP
ncbi:MAG: zinc-dependent metalloprotease [Gemmatimonadaceae bacterium]|nr:zinc-dependent metalloprotease [Gemmatimonadaceae bacterium]